MRGDKLEEEIERTVAGLPTEPGEEYMKQIRLPGDALIYSDIQNNKKFMRCYCSYCKNHFLMEKCNRSGGCSKGGYSSYYKYGVIEQITGERKYHKDSIVCPVCGKGTVALYDKAISGAHELSHVFRLCAYNVFGHLALLLFRIERKVRPDGTEFIKYYRLDGEIYISDKPIRVTGERKNYTNYSYMNRFERRKKYSLKECNVMQREVLGLTNELLSQTDSDKTGIYEYITQSHNTEKVRPFAYMCMHRKNPNIENLVKSGLWSYVQDVIDRAVSKNSYYIYDEHLNIEKALKYINPEEVKPFRIVGLEKHELWIAKSFPLWVTDYYKKAKAEGSVLSKEQLLFLEDIGEYQVLKLESLTMEKTYKQKVSVIKTVNYLISQKKKLKHNHLLDAVEFSYLKDYWDAVVEVYGSLRQDLMYPKNIINAHDAMLLAVEETEKPEYNKLMERFYDIRSKLEYTDKSLGFTIKPAKTHRELMQEGKVLHHCVARYAKNHAEGKTTILFIRRTESPDIPYCTLELNEGKVRQNRRYKNWDPSDEVKAFESKWLNAKETEIKNLTAMLARV